MSLLTSPLNRFIAASGLSNLSDGIATVVWAWMASLLTRDPLLIAIVPVALRLPWFVFAIPAGIVTDRVDRKRLIQWMDGVRVLAFGSITLVLWLSLPLMPAPQYGLAQPLVFYALMGGALIVGGAEVMRDNAAQTMLPALVPHEELERANGRLWSVELIGNSLIGPALGALLIAAYVPAPFALNTFAFAFALICVCTIKGSFEPARREMPSDWKREVTEAFRFLMHSPLLRTLAWITGGWNLLFQMSAIALVLHVQENLGFSATAYGFLLAAGAFGGISAGLVAEKIITRIGPKRTAQYSLMVSPFAFFLMAQAPNWPVLACTIAIFEFSGLLWNTVSVSYRQRRIPDEMLGRVNSLYRLMAWGLIPVGLVLSGVIVRYSEPLTGRSLALSLPMFVAGFGGSVLAVLGWRALNRWF